MNDSLLDRSFECPDNKGGEIGLLPGDTEIQDAWHQYC